jgi:hypothetical protein
VHADDLLRALRDGCDTRDADAAGVGGQDATRRCIRIQVAEYLSLRSTFSVAASTTNSALFTPAAMSVLVVMFFNVAAFWSSVKAALGHLSVQVLADGGQAFVQVPLRDVDQRDLMAALCEDMGDAVAHLAGTDDRDVHACSIAVAR